MIIKVLPLQIILYKRVAINSIENMKKIHNKTNACLFFLDVKKKFNVKVVKLPLCNNKHKTVFHVGFSTRTK